jgi:hypothetical protein
LRPGFTFITTATRDMLVGVTFGSVPLWPVGLGARVGHNP